MYSATWVAWLLFILLILQVINQSTQNNLVVVLRNVFSRSERFYTNQTRNWMNEIVSTIFSIGVLGLGVYILVNQSVVIRFLTYLQVLGIVSLVYFLQLLLVHGVGYVFLSPKKKANTIEQYRGIRTIVPLLLYPILLLAINCHNMMVINVLCMLIALIFVGLLLAKSWVLFSQNMRSILYMLLYIVYLEVMPLAIIVFWVQKVVVM